MEKQPLNRIKVMLAERMLTNSNWLRCSVKILLQYQSGSPTHHNQL